MKNLILKVLPFFIIGLTACSTQTPSSKEVLKADISAVKATDKAPSMVSIVEIAVTDFSRAKDFYEKILDIKIEEFPFEGTQLGLFPNDGQSVFVQLIKGEGYIPSDKGTLVYLNGGDDLQNVLNKIGQNGGTVSVPKTAIGQEMGFYAVFKDTEGNKIGLHSYQ